MPDKEQRSANIQLALLGAGTLFLVYRINRTLRGHKHDLILNPVTKIPVSDKTGFMALQGSTSMTTSNSTSHPKNIFVGGRMIGMSTSTTTSSSSSHPVNLYRN